MHEIGAKRQLEQLAGQIGRGSHPRGRKAQLARISLHEFGELLDALDLQRRTRDQHVRGIGRKSYRDEVLGLVVWDVGIKARIDHEARRDECEGIAVGRGSSRRAHAEIAARTGYVLDKELPARTLAELLRQ